VLQRLVKRSLFFAAALAVAAGILGLVYGTGYMGVRAFLEQHAERLAGDWFAAALQAAGGDPDRAAGRSDPDLVRRLGGVGIDAVLLIEGGGVTPTGGTDEAARRDFLAAFGGDEAADLLALPSGAHARNAGAKLLSPSFRSWVLLPTSPDGRTRLAVRVPQQDLGGQLLAGFQYQVFYLSCVAAITFFAFMAGYTYREKQLVEEAERMRHLAYHDELTGLPNRKAFEARLADSVARARAENAPAALLMIDLDGFKSVNDTLGHPVGDALLKAAAERLAGTLLGEDFLFRLSGDEFAIIVPDIAGSDALALLAGRIVEELQAPFAIDGHKVQVGCSVGIAVAPADAEDALGLVRNADFALYSAKAQGRATARFYDSELSRKQDSRRLIEAGLRVALDRGLFTLVYQPQRDLASGRVVAYEALLRWRLPEQGFVPASAFMAIAEETGLILPIGDWVINQAIRDLALLPGDVRVAVNLSPPQLKRHGLDAFIRERLEAHGIAPARFEIEVNESLLGRHEEDAFRVLESLRALGVAIVVDRFGAGTSSLGLLSRYPFDRVKVARAFVDNIDSSGQARAVLGAMCALGASLGLEVSGEGVETEEQARILREAGCRNGQGFYFGHPVPIEAIAAPAKPKTLAA